jgi:hypothetical protein
MPKIVSGGGITSNRYVTTREGKVEPKSTAISPAGVSQAGVSTAFKKENVEQGKGYTPGPMPATGVKGTYNSASQGPGSGRTIYGSGSQSATPQAKEMPKGRDTLAEFGKDIPGRR